MNKKKPAIEMKPQLPLFEFNEANLEIVKPHKPVSSFLSTTKNLMNDFISEYSNGSLAMSNL